MINNLKSQVVFDDYDFFEQTTLYLESYSSKNPDKIFRGSGFVVSKNARRFLITNYHVIDDKGYYLGKHHLPKGPYDMIKVVSLCPNKIQHAFTIKIRTDNKEHFFRNKYKKKLTDLVAIEIPKDEYVCVDVVDYSEFEKDKKEILNLNSEVIISGFPDLGDGKVKNRVLIAMTESKPQEDMIFDNKTRLPLIRINKTGAGGLSGSPVFKWSKRLEKYVFTGVYSASDDKNGNGFFWRPDVLLDLINNIE